MSLPTAPLGQLPSMNMPYNIPTYEKGPSIWEKALASFLVNAAGGVAQRGAENVMQRDNASEFGGKNATGFGRLLGPNVSDKEAEQKRAQAFTAKESGLNRSSEADLLDRRLLAQAGQSDADAANARLLQGDRTQAGFDEQVLRDKNAQLRTGQEIGANTDLARLKALLQAEDPGNQAQAARDRAAAGESNSRARFNELFLGGSGVMGTPKEGTGATLRGVDPSIAAFHKNGPTAPTGPAQGPNYVSGPADIQRFLAQGMSPEQITAIVKRQQATDAAAQALPLPNTTPQDDPRLAPLLRQLNMQREAPLTRGMMY